MRATEFGRGGLILRARVGEQLTLDAIREKIPSVFQEDRNHNRTSEQYKFIPTSMILSKMADEGFLPVEVRQAGSSDQDKRAYGKHMIRFRHSSCKPVVGDTFPETVLINAHDGSSCYQFMGGFFRLACANGMVVSEGTCQSIRVPHKGQVDDIIDASYRVVSSIEQQRGAIEDWSKINLNTEEQEAFATAAATLRFKPEQRVAPTSLLRVRRMDDQGQSLWKTFNVVQENLIQGGVRTSRIDRRRSRPVNGIDQSVELNRALWMLAEEMQKIKAS